MKKFSLFLVIFIAIYTNSYSQQQYSACTPVPINDSPCMSDANPPYDLGYNGSHEGTTCCAIGYNDNPNKDKPNEECGTAYDDDAVWYRVSINHDFDGVMINVYTEYGTTIGFEHVVEVYAGGENAICNETATFIRAYCIEESVTESHIGCLYEYDFLFIKISSTESDCGTFYIDVFQDNIWYGADKCENIEEEETIYPETSDISDLKYECISGFLNNNFCPESELSSICDVFENNPTIWYKVVVDQDANLLYTEIKPIGDWTPVWAIFKGDCSNLTNAANQNEYKCSSDSDLPLSPLITTVSEGTYYVAVSSVEGYINNPYFDICVSTTKKTVICLGEEDFCENDESTSFKIIERENKQLEPAGAPFNGPFCPGEKITLQVEFTYHTDQTYDERLLAMIPEFGSGWDINYYDLYINPPVAFNDIEADWYDEDGNCYPYLTEKFDYLCIYTDENSKLHLCNTLCEDCPCSGGMVEEDPIPSGYFWVQDSDENNCNPNDCSPSTKRGIEGIDGETPVYWTIELKVKDYVDSTCLENGDLSISFMTFSDGGAGCHSDKKAECLLDKPQYSPDWKVDCQKKYRIKATPLTKEICIGDTVGINIKSLDDTTKTIVISFDDNPYVLGEKKDTFRNGFGIINDTLFLINNEVCDSQIVNYYTEILDNTSFCSLRKDTIKVVVYAKPWSIVKKTDETFANANDGTATIDFECLNITRNLKWSTGDTTSNVDSLTPGKYYVTITNKLGCDYIEEIIINSFGCSDFSTFYTKNDLSCYGECTGSIHLDSVSKGDEPYRYLWSTGDTTTFVSDLCSGSYTITITDSKNCSFVDTVSVNSPSQLISNISSIGETFVDGKDGTAKVNPTGGTNPYKVSWDTGDTTLIIKNLHPGMYFVTVSDANGCSASDSILINTFECEVLSTISQKYDVSCFGECDGSIIISEVTYGFGTINYNWTNGNTTNSNKNLCEGEYSVTITDSLGCKLIDTFDIYQPDEILIAIDSVKNITNSGLGGIFITANGNYSYEWNGPKGTEGNSEDISGIDTAGCYTLLVTDTITNCSKDTTICIQNTTAINEQNSTENTVYIYPNPTKNIFYIDLMGLQNSQAIVSLLDISGRELFNTKLSIKNKANKISIENITKGLYFVKIKVKGQTIFKKLVVGK